MIAIYTSNIQQSNYLNQIKLLLIAAILYVRDAASVKR